MENITCYTFSQLHTFQPIWLGLEVVDKGENKASVLDVLSRHTAELCSATSLKRTLCWASFLFNNFNQIHQQGKKCERRWEKWVCIEELKKLILLHATFFWGVPTQKVEKETWSKMAWNGLKCILNTTLFFFKVWKMTRSGPPPPSVEYSTLFFDGFPYQIF